jgi:anti-sigma B factor antagonist
VIAVGEARIAMTFRVSPIGPAKDRQAAITVSTSGTTCVIAVHGEIDMSNAEELQADMVRGVDDSGCAHLLVDLSELTFLGSDGIRVFIKVHRHIHTRGGRMEMANPTPVIRSILKITGVDQLLGLLP